MDGWIGLGGVGWRWVGGVVFIQLIIHHFGHFSPKTNKWKLDSTRKFISGSFCIVWLNNPEPRLDLCCVSSWIVMGRHIWFLVHLFIKSVCGGTVCCCLLSLFYTKVLSWKHDCWYIIFYKKRQRCRVCYSFCYFL